jgi:anthranilate synthase component 1
MRIGSVHVPDMKHIENYSHVCIWFAMCRGELRQGLDAFDALYPCFPAGTLSGSENRAMVDYRGAGPGKTWSLRRSPGLLDFSGNRTPARIRTLSIMKEWQ